MDAFDLLVIGGGITGAGVARLAARNGLRTVLVERGDVMSATSSASSHMLHGGLRYLEHGRIGLVREALAERAALTSMAPDLARPRRFMVPVYRDGRFGRWTLKAGLQLYDWLAGSRGLAPHAMTRRSETLQLEPSLAADGLKGAGLYSDAVMDDARLGIAVVRDAASHGACIHTYTEVLGVRPGEGGGLDVIARDRIEKRERTFRARVVVNATGPWTDAMRQRLATSLKPGNPDPVPVLRPSRGVHLIYPPLTRGHGLLLSARSDGRVFFVVPLESHSLVGTTEVETPSPLNPDADRPSIDEVRYLRAELRQALPSVAGVAPIAVLSGVRPLMASNESVGQASREHRVIEEHGMLTIAGGKWTTFRVMARDVVERVAARLRAGMPVADSRDPLPRPSRNGEAPEALGAFAARETFARRLEDVLRRRTTLWMQPDRGRVAAAAVAAGMARELGWSAERQKEEVQRYESILWTEELLLRRSSDTMLTEDP